MSNWVTIVALIMFVLLFIVAAYMIARDWIRMAIGQVRFGRHMYEEFQADKQEWERQRALEGDTALEGGGVGSSGTSPDESASGRS